MKYCEKCGNQLPDEAKFCDKCGAKVEYGLLGDEASSKAPEDKSVKETPPGVAESVSKKEAQHESVREQKKDDSQPKVTDTPLQSDPAKMNKTLMIVIAVMAVLLVILLLVLLGSHFSQKETNSNYGEPDQAVAVQIEEGLTEVDLFDGLELKYTGTAPYGELQLSMTNKEIDRYGLRYTADKEDGLSNGDTITVSVTDYNGQNPEKVLQERFSVYPAALEKTYTVEGLAKYVESLDEIPDDLMERMKKQAEDTFLAQFAESSFYGREDWDGDGDASQYRRSELESFAYVGEYLLTAKAKEVRPNNKLVLIYKPTVTFDWKYNSLGVGEQLFNHRQEYYWAIAYSDILIDQEGTVVSDVADFEKTGNQFTVNTNCDGRPNVYFSGYQVFDDLRKDYISANLENYEHEDNINDTPVDTNVNSEEPDESVSSDQDYVLSKSSTEYISVDDLKELSEDELKIARNEIYARHGRKFQDEELRKYFESKSWYKGTIEPDDFDDKKMLNDYEIKNLDTIVMLEKSR